MRGLPFNRYGVWAIYRFEMARFMRTVWQSLVTPVITTSLYFVVFGAAIGSRMSEVGGVAYGAFIVPGLIMLSLFTESIFNASFRHPFSQVHGHDRVSVEELKAGDMHGRARGVGGDIGDPAGPTASQATWRTANALVGDLPDPGFGATRPTLQAVGIYQLAVGVLGHAKCKSKLSDER